MSNKFLRNKKVDEGGKNRFERGPKRVSVEMSTEEEMPVVMSEYVIERGEVGGVPVVDREGGWGDRWKRAKRKRGGRENGRGHENREGK